MSDIGELMATDPLKLTKESRREIITYFRDNRVKFLVAGKAPRAAKKPVPEGGLSLDDLDL